MKEVVSGYVGLRAHAIWVHELAELPVARGQRGLWQAQRMGVVRLTRCQPESAARQRGSTQAWKNDTIFTSCICFIYVKSQQPQIGHFLASRKPAQTINRMCLTCNPMFFSDMYSFPLWIFNTTFVWSLQKYLTGSNQVLNSVSCSSESFIGLPALCL